ncbi:hypothetical protein DXG01_005814 [Tephrocybe rancida]|nr:hypothetical protein DXG01_005814 [Tephrocybe rancida]
MTVPWHTGPRGSGRVRRSVHDDTQPGAKNLHFRHRFIPNAAAKQRLTGLSDANISNFGHFLLLALPVTPNHPAIACWNVRMSRAVSRNISSTTPVSGVRLQFLDPQERHKEFFKAAWFHSQSHAGPEIVSVPVNHLSSANSNIQELAVEFWVTISTLADPQLANLSRTSATFEGAHDETYTVWFTPQRWEFGRLHHFFDRPGQTWIGDVLVAKQAGTPRRTCDITKSDLPFITTALIKDLFAPTTPKRDKTCGANKAGPTSRPTLRINHATPFNSAAASVYSTAELIDLIRSQLDFVGRIRLSHASHADHDAFWACLEHSGGGITGSIAWFAIMCHHPFTKAPAPRNLNIVIPVGTMELWSKLMTLVKYHGEPAPCPERPGTNHQRCAATMAFQNDRHQVITVWESWTPSVIPVIVGSASTAQMNLITATHIYSFYPVLTTLNIGIGHLGTDATEEQIDLMRARSQIFVRSAHGLYDACGDVCPTKWRYTEPPNGIGQFRWKDGKEHNSLLSENFKWRMGTFCRNRNCPNNNYTF